MYIALVNVCLVALPARVVALVFREKFVALSQTSLGWERWIQALRKKIIRCYRVGS